MIDDRPIAATEYTMVRSSGTRWVTCRSRLGPGNHQEAMRMPSPVVATMMNSTRGCSAASAHVMNRPAASAPPRWMKTLMR